MGKSAEQSKAIFQSMITLAGAALGLVCALAWNDAIKQTMKSMLGEDDSLAGLYAYAVLATLLGVFVLLALAKASAKVGGEAAISREAEG
jgi:flagellar motor component MotA